MSNRTNASQQDLPAVAVIVPVFNDQSGIDACLAALERQTYPADRFEVVVVDNASNPPVVIGRNHSFPVRCIVCETPGSYAARNAGTGTVAAEVVAFTDADCVPEPEWLAAGVGALARGEGRRIVGGEVRLELSDRPSAVELYQAMDGFDQRGNIEARGFAVTANLFAGIAALRDIGPFDERLLSGGDLDWSRRAVAAGYELVYAANAVVATRPRTSLAAAARQARRVAGGRRAMRAGKSPTAVAGPRRGTLASIRRILGHTEFSCWDRLRVLWAASLLYLARIGESAMLAMGRNPERR